MRHRIDAGNLVFQGVTLAIIIFLFFPIGVTILVSFNEGGFVMPPSSLTLKWYKAAITSDIFLSGMRASLIIGLIASLGANIVGGLTALALTRFNFKGKALVNMFVMSPLLVPMTILALALYCFLVRMGSQEGLFNLIVGHIVVILPFSIRVIMASLQNFDRSLEEAAMNQGAGPIRTFFTITFPVIKTGILAGFMMCFILSWNDFAISVFLASPDWIPLPVQIFSYIKFQYDPVAAALVSMLILFSGVVIVLLDRLVGLGTVMGIQNKG